MRRNSSVTDRDPSANTRMDASLGVDNALSRALYRMDWSDTALAHESGISRSRINGIKNGRIEPTLVDALVICAALKMRISDLFAVAYRSNG